MMPITPTLADRLYNLSRSRASSRERTASEAPPPDSTATGQYDSRRNLLSIGFPGRSLGTRSFLFSLVFAASVYAFHSSSADDSGKAGWISFDKCMVFAAESVELPSQETGTIASLTVRENDSVAANQVIGKLDGKIAELEENAAGLQMQVATSEAMDESEIRLAEAFVEETKLQADQYEEMAAKGNASRGELKQRQLAAEQAKVRLGQSKTAKQQRELKSKLAQSAFVLSQQKVERLTLRSPISGTVTRIDHRAGEWVQSGTTVVKIIRLDEVRIDCFVNIDQLAPSSLVGKSIKVLSKRGSNELLFAGRITSYDPDVTGTGQVRVHATVQNQKQADHWMLLPGMSVSMQLPKP